jgi:hypothetical protein
MAEIQIPILTVGERYRYKNDSLGRVWEVYFDEKQGKMAMNMIKSCFKEEKHITDTLLHLFTWENMEKITDESEGK